MTVGRDGLGRDSRKLADNNGGGLLATATTSRAATAECGDQKTFTLWLLGCIDCRRVLQSGSQH